MGIQHRVSISTALLLMMVLTCDVTAQNFGGNFFLGAPEGVAGEDYPTLTTIPRRTGFTCRDRKPGFYADPSTRCQVWHWCDTFLVKHSFLCPNLTVFNQQIRGCDWWYNVDCSLATSLYSNNDELYRDKDEDYDENGGTNNNQIAGSTNRAFINVEVHTTPRPVQRALNVAPTNSILNDGFGSSETIHSGVAVSGNAIRDSVTLFPRSGFDQSTPDADFQSTTEQFISPQLFDTKTLPPPPPPFPPTPPPTAPPAPTTSTTGNNNRIIFLTPGRQSGGFNFNIPNAIPIAFPTARPSSRFGPDPLPTSTSTPTTFRPTVVQANFQVNSNQFDSQRANFGGVHPTPGEFGRGENSGGLTQGINLRRRLISRGRGQKKTRANTNGFAVDVNSNTPSPSPATTPVPPSVNEPSLTSHIHFVAGDPGFDVSQPQTTTDIFAVEQTTSHDSANVNFNVFANDPAFNNPITQDNNNFFTDPPVSQTQNDFFDATTTQQQQDLFTTTENDFSPPQQTEDATLQQQPVTNPPLRSPKRIHLRKPVQQQSVQFASRFIAPSTTTQQTPPPQTPFFNTLIPYGARLSPPSVTSPPATNSLDDSGVFRRHDVFTTTTTEASTTTTQRNNAHKVSANATSPTTIVATSSNASFRKRKFLNGSNSTKINTFPPFPVTTFSPKVGGVFESTKQQQKQNQTSTSRRRKVPITAATVWFKIFPSSSTTTSSTTTTTTTTVAPSTTSPISKSVTSKKSAAQKKRRTFPSFPITTFKPRINIALKITDSQFGERDSVTSSTTQLDDVTDTTWASFSTSTDQ